MAKFAVASVDNPAAENVALPLGGPDALSLHEAVKIFEKASGKPFEVSHVPADALKAQMEGATDPMQKSFAGLMFSVAKGEPIDMKPVLKQFPIKLQSVAEYARRVVAPATD